MKKSINSKTKGFTIVELLVVIVVIGILAAISVVSYSGVSNKAKTMAAKEAAASIATIANSYYAENSSYPTTLAQINGYALVAKPSTITLGTAVVANGTNGSTTVKYGYCTTGFTVSYYDASTGSATTNPLTYDNGTACVTYTYPSA